MTKDEKLAQILIEKKYASKEDISKAKDYAEKTDTSITDYLLYEDILTKDLIGQAIAETYDIPYTDLNSHVPSKEQVLKIPQTIALDHRIVLFEEKKDEVILATDSPLIALKFF